MTITTSVNKIIATGDAIQVDFPYDFIVLAESHMNVYLNGVLEDTANWSMTGLGVQAGGVVTMTSAPADGVKVTLLRIVPNTQLVDYSAYGSFPAETHERALDLRVMEAQQLEEAGGRALKAPLDDEGVFDYSLPAPVANRSWKINGTNDAIILTTNDPDEQEALAAVQVGLATDQAVLAAAQASAAAGSASAASGSATAAQLRAWEAEAEQMTADSYATEAEDTFVNTWASDGDGTFTATPTTEYSALHYAAKSATSAASVSTDHDSLNSVMLPTDWQTVNKQGWDHFGFNQQWGGAPWGGRLPDGTNGEVATGLLNNITSGNIGAAAGQQYRGQGFKVPMTINCGSIGIPLAKVGNPTRNLEVFIYSDSSGSPGVLITNGTATAQSGKLHSTDRQEAIFSFPIPPTLTADTQYHLVVTATVDAVNSWLVYLNNEEAYPYGYLNNGSAGPVWTPFTASMMLFKVTPTAATATIRDGKFNAADTTQLGQAPALTQSLKDVIKRDKDGKFTFQFKVGDVPTASKPLCQAYYDNDTHITVETDALSHAIIRSNGSTITGTSVLAADDSVAAMYNGTNLALYVNGVAEGVAVAASYPDDFDTGSFIIGGAIPTDLTWTKETDMSLLPSADGWTYTGTATEASAFSVSGGKLYQNAAGYGSTDTGDYRITTTLNNTTGWRVDTKFQVSSAANVINNLNRFMVIDGVKIVQLYLNEYFLEVASDGSLGYIQHDFKAEEPTVSVYGKGSDFYIIINGKLVFDGTGLLTGTSALNEIRFGDGDAGADDNADAIWHYVNYIESYEAPTFTTTPLYDFGFWQKDASSLLVDLAASDVKSITGLKRDWVEEAERVVVKRGIVSTPTMTSTEYEAIPDLSAFAVCPTQVDAMAVNVVKNSAAGQTATVNTSIDGIFVTSDASVHESGNVNDRGSVSTRSYRSTSGLLYLAPSWKSSSANIVAGDFNYRNSTVVTK